MKFSKGDLVQLSGLFSGPVDLTRSPSAFSNQIGFVYKSDILIVIDPNIPSCLSICVLTPRYIGWISSAFIKKIY